LEWFYARALSWQEFAGKAAVIPGGSSGFGPEIARASAKRRISKNTGCYVWNTVAIVQPMGGKAGTNNLSLSVRRKPFWKVLNELALQGRTFYWSVIQYHSAPCMINLAPL
jgi:hypothetical protein